MREAWHVVESYIAACAIRAIYNLVVMRSEPVFLALTLAALLLNIALAFLTFSGKRIASRVLSVLILIDSVYVAVFFAIGSTGIAKVYWLIVMGYFVIGAIKLWRIKELPTRFTDPQEEPPAHA